ncbi:PadR family transcriptional regulator [Halorubrum ezzemoulense]|nr:PadR family transcriptional regulator [Halorubrum ezzemoulense]
MPNSHAESDTAHPLADLSATHRDLLWLLSQTGPSELPPLRQALADYYTDGIDRTHCCDTLEALRERDLIAKQTHDTTTYRLTESARRALSARQAWQAGNRSTTEREDE